MPQNWLLIENANISREKLLLDVIGQKITCIFAASLVEQQFDSEDDILKKKAFTILSSV
jgi:hypothetical protein